jgi:hypothetical protein
VKKRDKFSRRRLKSQLFLFTGVPKAATFLNNFRLQHLFENSFLSICEFVVMRTVQQQKSLPRKSKKKNPKKS